jgi:hypothetical protein
MIEMLALGGPTLIAASICAAWTTCSPGESAASEDVQDQLPPDTAAWHTGVLST